MDPVGTCPEEPDDVYGASDRNLTYDTGAYADTVVSGNGESPAAAAIFPKSPTKVGNIRAILALPRSCNHTG